MIYIPRLLIAMSWSWHTSLTQLRTRMIVWGCLMNLMRSNPAPAREAPYATLFDSIGETNTHTHTHTLTRTHVRAPDSWKHNTDTDTHHHRCSCFLRHWCQSDSRMSRSSEPALFDDSDERNERFINNKKTVQKNRLSKMIRTFRRRCTEWKSNTVKVDTKHSVSLMFNNKQLIRILKHNDDVQCYSQSNTHK